MAGMTEQEILDCLADSPRMIFGGPPRDIYFDLQKRGLITMRSVRIDSQETAIRVALTTKDTP